jgi:hypothetical protein
MAGCISASALCRVRSNCQSCLRGRYERRRPAPGPIARRCSTGVGALACARVRGGSRARPAKARAPLSGPTAMIIARGWARAAPTPDNPSRRSRANGGEHRLQELVSDRCQVRGCSQAQLDDGWRIWGSWPADASCYARGRMAHLARCGAETPITPFYSARAREASPRDGIRSDEQTAYPCPRL